MTLKGHIQERCLHCAKPPSVVYVILALGILSFQVAFHSYQSLPSLSQLLVPSHEPKSCPGPPQPPPNSALTIALYRLSLTRALQILHAGDEASYDCILPGLGQRMSAAVWLQARRWLRVTTVCEAARLRAPTFPFKFMLIAEDINVGFCTNYKAGTTTWIRYLLEWSGVAVEQNTDTASIHSIGDQVFNLISNNTRLGEEFVQERRPFLFFSARHPLERLVSFYRDRLLRDDSLFREIKVMMLRNVGNKDLQEVLKSNFSLSTRDLEGKPANISFPQFVRFMLGQYIPCEGDVHCLERRGNVHYRPTYVGCGPCFTDYDFISKVETLKEDVEIVEQIVTGEKQTQKIALVDSEQWPLNTLTRRPSVGGALLQGLQMNPSAIGVLPRGLRLNPSVDASSTKGSTALYMSQLTAEEVDHLKQLYRVDFLLLDYDPDDYL